MCSLAGRRINERTNTQELTYYTTNGPPTEQMNPDRRVSLLGSTCDWRMSLRGAVRIALTLLVLTLVYPGVSVRAGAPEDSIRLVFVGDVMLGRWIGELSDRYGAGYPLAPVAPLLAAADIAFGNLESPLTDAPYLANGYNLQAAPAQVVALEGAGFDVVSLANNHVTDHGVDGVLETIRVLDQAGIAHVGAGANITDAHQVWIENASAVKVAFLAYDRTGGSVPATEVSAGSARAANRMLTDIAGARQNADLVVVSLHWGDEYRSTPAGWQREYARTLAVAGADLIVGHHPHVVQPLEWLEIPGRDRPALVAYSLGNFIFDQEFSTETSESVLLSCQAGLEGVRSARLLPVCIRQGRVSPLGTADGEGVLTRIMPVDRPAIPAKMFSATVLPTGERDFQVSWWVAPEIRRDSAPLSLDVDGDGQSERVQLAADGACVLSADEQPLWCTSRQWQVWRAVLDDFDGDGLAELVTLAQHNEERGPAWGGMVQVWEWQDGRFELLWRSVVGDYRELWVADMDGDATRDIGVDEGS